MDGHRWIDALPDTLARQRALLTGLLAAVQPEPRWDWLELAASVAEGRGDRWSDLDMGLGYVGESPTGAEVEALVRSLGPVVDLYSQPWAGMWRWWIFYDDGAQLDLCVLPATARNGRPPGSVALLDRSGRLADTTTPAVWSAGEDELRGWLLEGWEALSNVVKYLARGSVLEAVEQIARARTQAFRLWAAGERLPYPVFGLTSLLDAAEIRLPPGLPDTYAPAASAETATAARATADLLARAAEHARPGLDTPLRARIELALRA